MLIFLKSKVLGAVRVEQPLYIARGRGRSRRFPHAGQGCGRMAASGEENSILAVRVCVVGYVWRSGLDVAIQSLQPGICSWYA